MNWLTNFVKPKLSALVKRKEVPENLWNNCPTCGNMIHHKDLNENLRVCVKCNYHFRMSVEKRIEFLFDKNQHIGGHSLTAEAIEDKKKIPIDMGFMVFNKETYPNLTRLFDKLNVPYKKSNMSFSVHVGL